jgi:hypothetical protein
MSNQDDQYEEYTAPDKSEASRLPLALGVSGAVLGALALGFVVANALTGGGGGGSNADQDVDDEPTVSAMKDASGGSTLDPKRENTPTPAPPTATSVPPTATPVPPTPTPTVPAITSPKFHDIFRAEGGAVSKNADTAIPVRRLEAEWNNSYKNCPSASCIRGRASVMAGVGPFGSGESPVASASVYNTFVAERANANLLMKLRWKGSLAAVVGANANTGVEITINVSEINPDTKKIIKAVPNMPYEVLSEELGLEAIQGISTLKIEDSRSVNIPLKLEPDHLYRIDLSIKCSTRVLFSLSATTCSFFDEDAFAGVEWTSQVIEYDTGVCTPSQKGEGCIYQ